MARAPFSSLLLGQLPRFQMLTDPRFRRFLSDQQQAVNLPGQLDIISGADSGARYGRTAFAPHVRTAPNVYESIYRLLGVEDPRQAKWDAMTGRRSSPQPQSPAPSGPSPSAPGLSQGTLTSLLAPVR